MRNTRGLRSKPARLVAAVLVTGLTAAALAVLYGGAEQHASARAMRQALATPGGGTEPGEVSLKKVEQFWQTRLTYPTGRFDQRWVNAAAKQARRVKVGIPKGLYRTRSGKLVRATGIRSGAQAVQALSAAKPLGPQPQASTGCQAPCFTFGLVSGRINAIAFDPKNPSVAYVAQDGGGIWKSTNCCTPFTTWTVTTDAPNVPTTATDDVTVDPNNSNVVYAATGDLSFGSFAFGSAGVLKSTDAGATWQTLGAKVFTPAYPAASGGTYPQYQAVSKVRVDPNDSKKIVAGTKTGLYFSYDAGANWSGPCLTNRFSTQRQDITGLILRDDGATTSIYAAVGARGYGTFVQQNLGLNGANAIYRLGAMPASGCPAATSWTALTNGWPVGTASGVPCNPPLGDTVTPCAATANKLGRIELAIAPSDPQVLYAEVQKIDPQPNCGALQLVSATTARGCFLGLWRTSDGGTTWTQVADHSTMSFPEGTTTAGPCGEDTPQMWYDMALAVDPNNPDALFLDAIDIWKSTDGGKTLTDISCGYHTGVTPVASPVHVDQHALAYQPGSSTNLMAGSDGGIYVSNDAANAPQGTATGIVNPPTFKDVNLTMNTIEFYGGDISQNFATSSTPFIVGGAQDNGSSYGQFGPGATCPDTGCQWSQRIGGDGFYARIEPKQGQRVFMESQNGNLQRSTTGPAGPYLAATGGWAGDRLSFIFPYKIDKFACPTTTCDHMIAGSYRVFESINGASNWYLNSPDLTKGNLGDRSYINQLDYAPTTNGNAIVGTNDGNVQYGFGLGTGTANTATWVNVTGANRVLPNRPVQDVAISPQNALVGYAAVGGFNENTSKTPGHVFQLTCTTFCNTFTWVNKSGNLPNIPVNAIAVNPNAPKQVFAGTDWGLYYTDDITAATPVWNHFQNGLPNTMIWSFSIDRGATTLAVFTRSRGAWVIPLPASSGQQFTVFSDDFETNKGWATSSGSCNWTATGDAHSPSTAWTTAPYTDVCDTNLDSPSIAMPSGSDTIRLSFSEKHNTEDYGPAGGAGGCPCDYGVVQLSTDNGATYASVGNVYAGAAPAYSQTTIPLPDSASGKTIKLRFHFHSDANTSVPDGGWWVDDPVLTAEH
ncbi:MAG: hypothetical protein ACJ744_11460 [Gaiellaceae bacterium]